MTFKRFCIAALTLAPLTACTSGDEPAQMPSRSVTFNATTTDRVTRADRKPLPADYTLFVSAVHHKEGAPAEYYLKSKQFRCFSDVWAAEGCYYPDGGTMDFLAYAIQDKAHQPDTAYSGLNPLTGSFGSLTLDFANRLDGSDPVVFSNVILGASCEGSVTPLPLYFSYATACVVVSVEPADEWTAERLTLKNLRIAELPLSGTLSLAVSESQTTAQWTAVAATRKNFTLGNFSNPATLPAEQTIYPLPTTARTSIVLTYRVEDETFDRTYTYALPTAWERAQRYNYIFTVNLHKVEVGASEAEWSVETQTTALEEFWTAETGASACEEMWDEDENPIIIQ